MQKIIIVDDHKIFRKGLKFIIEEYEFAEVVAEASSAEEYFKIIEKIIPDIVFMDINLPNINGFEATKKTLKINSKINIIAMSVNDDIASINEMLNSGAKGYLEKSVDYDEIHQAIKSISEQKNYFSTNIFIKLTKNINKREKNTKSTIKYYKITKREKDVLIHICKGLSNFEISEKLFISERTVEKHKSNLFFKTNTSNALNLALFAFHNEIINFFT